MQAAEPGAQGTFMLSAHVSELLQHGVSTEQELAVPAHVFLHMQLVSAAVH